MGLCIASWAAKAGVVAGDIAQYTVSTSVSIGANCDHVVFLFTFCDLQITITAKCVADRVTTRPIIYCLNSEHLVVGLTYQTVALG